MAKPAILVLNEVLILKIMQHENFSAISTRFEDYYDSVRINAMKA